MPRRRNNPVACVILLPACKAGEAHVGKRVMRARLKLALSVAGTVMVAVPASAADDATLQRQLKTVVDQLQAVSLQNQRQLDEMTRQLQDAQQRNQRDVSTLNDRIETLQQQLGRQAGLTVVESGKPPPPDARDVVVTQQPGNLPGRSVAPPYTAAGPATPGSVPPTPAAPVSSGGDRVKLSISGQVDRALLYGNDGKASNLRNVDNNVSSTRLRFVGEGRVTDTMTGGSNLEARSGPTRRRPRP